MLVPRDRSVLPHRAQAMARALLCELSMRIHQLGPWLRPALIGPWLAMALYVTVAVFLFDQHDPLLGTAFQNWLIAMAFGSVWSVVIGAALLVVDLVRLRRGVLPPTGARAWLGAALAVAITGALYWLWPPGRLGTLIAWSFAILWPIAVAAIVARGMTWTQRETENP